VKIIAVAGCAEQQAQIASCPNGAEHAMGGAPVPIIEPGWENIHLVRGTRDGKTSIIVCQRYERETDCFVDVDPQTLGIEE
jgi:hypothetical protein